MAEWDLRWPHAPAVRARNGILYLTLRRFSAQDRLNALRAIKRPKAEAADREAGFAGDEIWPTVAG
jgi:hypothetical protein